MENNTINASVNPGLANQLAEKALSEATPAPVVASITAPLDVTVDLPGGYISPDTGEVYRTAEVRELNGRDEELIVKASTFSKAMQVILSRGTVKIGDVPATDSVLDNILVADRDALALGIYRATFGETSEVLGYCNTCETQRTVQVEILKDIPVEKLEDPLEDRMFIVKGRSAEYTVKLPEGKLQRELGASSNKNNAELDTIVLEYCVTKINGRTILNKSQVQAIGLADRRKILAEILSRNPGPRFDDIKVNCPDCGGEVVVPISLGTLFRV